MATQKSNKKSVANVPKEKDMTLKAKIQSGWDQVESESKRILNALGADLVNEDKSVSAVLSRIRQHNPDLKSFVINLDSATYDVRVKMNWDAHMLSAYAMWQMDKALTDVVKPKIEACISNAEAKKGELMDKAQELTTKFSH